MQDKISKMQHNVVPERLVSTWFKVAVSPVTCTVVARSVTVRKSVYTSGLYTSLLAGVAYRNKGNMTSFSKA